MAALEEEGYIQQPHTSAGRIPTDKGYRLFVDKLTSIKPLSPAERRAISTFLEGAVDLDDVVNRTVRLLAQLTRQVAVVQYPTLTRSKVRHVELVTLSSTRLLLVLITSTGRVEQRVVDVKTTLRDDLLRDIRNRLNAKVVGKKLSEVSSLVSDLPDTFDIEDRPYVATVLATFLETVVERPDERIAVGGTANLIPLGHEFHFSIRPVLEALEEQVVLLRLLGEANGPSRGVTVRIGSENPYAELSSASVVASGYGPGDETVANLGVVGPTRMDYPGTMGAVRAVARYVSRILASE
jgi:heat-inducible transcriptional repressor